MISNFFCSRKLRLYFKPFLSLGLGLTLGLVLSTLIIPIPDDCSAGKSKHSSKFIEKDNIMVDGRLPEYMPRIIKTDGLPLPTSKGKLVRPRYAATELGIREKLFVAVLTKKETIETLGIAWNRTVAHYVSKVMYFVSDKLHVQQPSGMSLIQFTDGKHEMLPFNVFRYVGEHYSKVFDWFLFVHDDTYIRAEKLLDVVSQMSISHDVYMGKPLIADAENTYCDVSGGYILSNVGI